MSSPAIQPRSRSRRACLAAAGFALMLPAVPQAAHAEEGMWLLDHLPRRQLAARYHFDPSAAWVSHVERASINFGGASAEFVSADGLIMTNNHVSEGPAQQIGTPAHDYVADGYTARGLAQELPVPGLRVTVLQSITNETPAVSAAVDQPGLTPQQREQALRAVTARLTAQATGNGYEGRLVSLYGGARYDLYRSKTYTDVRLVFKPEGQAGNFGGNADNFEYPRFAYDVAFFRAYENGKPASTPDYLTLDASGPKDGELLFVVGHPGRTYRYQTSDDLLADRDVQIPLAVTELTRLDYLEQQYALRGPAQNQAVEDSLLGLDNSLKLLQGQEEGLQDPAILSAKRAQEATWAAELKPYPQDYANYLAARATLAQVALRSAAQEPRLSLVQGLARFSPPTGIALQTVRYVEQPRLPEARRLPGYNAAALPGTKARLLAPQPFDRALERRKLADGLEEMAEMLGTRDPDVEALLGGQSPVGRADALVAGSRIDQASVRAGLVAGGPAAIQASGDTLVRFAVTLDRISQRLYRSGQAVTDQQERIAGATLARLLLKHSAPDALYPDATGTLRLSYGVVQGYTQDGQQIAPFTTFAGLFQRSAVNNDANAYQLAPSWAAAKSTLDLSTPFDFVATLDTTGGNSGSAVIDEQGREVGILFDGNIQSLICDFVYTQVQGRSVCVDSSAIYAGLRGVYHDDALAAELAAGHL